MKTNILVFLPFAGIVHASPARHDCGETKSFITTNECGTEHGGTWIECANGMTATPTFTAPPCVIAAQSTNDPLITSAPTLPITLAVEATTATSTCSKTDHMVCVDFLYWCNGKQRPWGDCFNPCTREMTMGPCPSLTSGTTLLPPNTLPPISPTDDPTPTRSVPILPTLNAVKAPPREDKAWCKDKPFMCAPAGW